MQSRRISWSGQGGYVQGVAPLMLHLFPTGCLVETAWMSLRSLTLLRLKLPSMSTGISQWHQLARRSEGIQNPFLRLLR